MYCHKAYHKILLILWLILVVAGSVSAQRSKVGRQEQRGVNVVPAVPAPPAAERRTALVIGNSSYAEGPLANPVNDATDMASALQQLGFAVTLLRDADLRRMRDAIETFRKQLYPGVLGLFYFAGHGLQVKGENYLVPTGARIAREQDIEFETVHVGRILGAMEDAANGVNIIILDACRNNPFTRSFRSSQRGLAVTQAITGSLIAYATAPGAVAADGSGRNGVFTYHLLQNLLIPGLPIEQVFKNVRIGVMKESGNQQIPWESSSLTGNVTFMPAAENPALGQISQPQGTQVAVGVYPQQPNKEQFVPVPGLAQNELFIPLLVYRTGPYAPNGIPIANGYIDYLKLLNARDGGINGVKITWEECETQYDTKLGVECYEKLKSKGTTGATLVNPNTTGITYQLIPKAPVDKIPIHSMGYGRTASADGRVFEWAFNFPSTYWSQVSAFVKYIGEQEGGMDKLKGKKIALVHHNSPYGKEPIPTLEILAKQHGFELTTLAVDHPGQEQKATWLQIRRSQPNWILLWGWGVMNQVAIKEAAAINYPMDHFIGVWWSGSEVDVVPAGEGAKGYKSGNFHGVGTDFPVHTAILKQVYNGDQAAAKANNIGEVLYNRGLINAVYDIEAVRTAMVKFGNKPLTGEQVRWGFEHLDLTEARLKELGLEGFARPIKVTCEDHESNGPVFIQQWDGKQWKKITDWIAPMREVVRPQLEQAAADYAKENNITPRNCASES